MNALTIPSPQRADNSMFWLFRSTRTERDAAARPSDSMVVFSVVWGMAMMLSAASHTFLLRGSAGLTMALLAAAALGSAALLVMNPRRTSLLLLVSGLMIAIYVLRLPVPSNNQTISLFMNTAILIAFSVEAVRGRGSINRAVPYEQLRVVARALLAIMYFYGVFHKINTGFLNPETSCATALYQPLARPFGLENNIVGIYGAIAATFIVETIAIVCLYWRRFFWVGLLVSLPFHYVIPISGYSWYMDFSSLVFALYMLSVPREVATGLYSTGVALVRRVQPIRAGISGIVALALTWIVAALIVAALSTTLPKVGAALMWHSTWMLVWTVFGGVAMLLIMRAALLEQPYRTPASHSRQSWWVYALPAVLFISCTSPYIGLKTESSITMFSNLHTEGGVSNHLLFPKPPYLFDYQARPVRILDTSDPSLKARAANPHFGMVEHDIAIRLLHNPSMWITYEQGGRIYEKVTRTTFTGHRPSLIEQKLLDFKPIDWARPKVCTH